MLKENILDLLNYNLWANTQLLQIIDEAIVDTEVISSFSSIRKTVYHSWDAETIWFERLKNVDVTPWPASGLFKGSFSEAVKSILAQEQEIISYIENSSEAFLLQTITYKNLKGLAFTNSNFHVLQHVVNHSTMHRGQIVTLLRQFGVSTIPSTDLIAYYRQKQ